MKAILASALLFATSSASYAGSVCTVSLPGTCGSSVTVNCDGKEMRNYSYENCGDKSDSQLTDTLKKLIDQDYKIASDAIYGRDGGEKYTLTK